MKTHQVVIPKNNQQYININDRGFGADRTLLIDDERGGRVELKNDEIGELFKQIKPALMG